MVIFPTVRQSPSSLEMARRSRGWRQWARDDFRSAASDDASVKSGSCEMSRSISAACSADAFTSCSPTAPPTRDAPRREAPVQQRKTPTTRRRRPTSSGRWRGGTCGG
uniref:Uncharacterized protein n=1 Tax=Oryza meridionalis TaxID=40149 RepID=A0A0E0DQ48_9ORYZ